MIVRESADIHDVLGRGHGLRQCTRFQVHLKGEAQCVRIARRQLDLFLQQAGRFRQGAAVKRVTRAGPVDVRTCEREMLEVFAEMGWQEIIAHGVRGQDRRELGEVEGFGALTQVSEKGRECVGILAGVLVRLLGATQQVDRVDRFVEFPARQPEQQEGFSRLRPFGEQAFARDDRAIIVLGVERGASLTHVAGD